MKRLLLFLILSALMLSLSGCVLEPAESLYAVPRQMEDFYDLQSAIQAAMPVSGAYCPPTRGDNQQVVQLSDLDGDGEDEAIVFFKSDSDSPLSLCVFARQESRYVLLAQIDGTGSAFDQVHYAQIDGQGGNEIVVGRKISDQVTQTVNVYSLKNGTLTELMNANYTELITADLDADGLTDVLLLRTDGDAQEGVAEYYHWRDGQLLREREARMNSSAQAVRRIITGKMSANIPAVFVASEFGQSGIVTDVFVYEGESFRNLALPRDTDTSVQTVREYYVYSCDIDGDGLIELPRLISLPSLPDDSSTENQSLICWYNLLLDGSACEKVLTYHNYSGLWYLTVPEEWAQELTVSRVVSPVSGQAYAFSLLSGEESTLLFTVAAVSGEEPEIPTGWEKLAEKGDSLYLCRVSQSEITAERLRTMFHFIQVDWNTGETE